MFGLNSFSTAQHRNHLTAHERLVLPDESRFISFTNVDDHVSDEVITVISILQQMLKRRQEIVYPQLTNPDPYHAPANPPLFARGDVPKCSNHEIIFSNHFGCFYLRNKDEKTNNNEQNESKFSVEGHACGACHRMPQPPNIYFDRVYSMNYLCNMGFMRTFAEHRLKLLEEKFNLHISMNGEVERDSQRKSRRRDFHSVGKVDNHIHAAAAFNAKRLLLFIREKIKKEPNTIVHVEDGVEMTLMNIFERLNLEPYDISLDSLAVSADSTLFQRFDKFNKSFSLFESAILRTVFLKTNNHLNGRFFAELLKSTFNRLERCQYVELRLSIYGKSLDEWDHLAKWFIDHDMAHPRVRWLIQIPRLFTIHQKNGFVQTFSDFIQNIFLPLFEVTVNPDSHRYLFFFLQHVVGFDTVDDESKPEQKYHDKYPMPTEWDMKIEPPYAYYLYFLYSNIYSLNEARRLRGLSPLALRPHAGEAGHVEHLVATFLTSQGINHGINLRLNPVLQYLYYLAKIPISVSPVSNNTLFLDLKQHPFAGFFKRGLFVTLSTDDPLQFHLTQMPLLEEYSISAKIFNFRDVDLCEIAKNSVLMSGLDVETKQKWLGRGFDNEDLLIANDSKRTNVPNLRLHFRRSCFNNEHSLLSLGVTDVTNLLNAYKRVKQTNQPQVNCDEITNASIASVVESSVQDISDVESLMNVETNRPRSRSVPDESTTPKPHIKGNEKISMSSPVEMYLDIDMFEKASLRSPTHDNQYQNRRLSLTNNLMFKL
ncbi:hypothetical protein PCE1_003865 [Barthelona sp. PCE]